MAKRPDKKVRAFIASFFTIIGFLIAIIIWKDDEYTMYYANHGLILFIGQIIIGLFQPFSFFIPRMYITILWVLWAILWVMTWINALSGQIKKTVIITELAQKIPS